MTTTTPLVAHSFAVRADYLCDGAPFAQALFTIAVSDGVDPYGLARMRAAESTYANERVPDLSITITLTPEPPEDPEPHPPSGAGGAG
ncbi:hypothetical protein BH10PSE12_BH10PSE12_07870 [soil metagenome]